MIRLHKITFRPLFYYPTFWILLGLHLVLCNIIVLGLENFLSSFQINGNAMSPEDLKSIGLFSFPDLWHNITYVAGYFKFILALIIIINVCNDFSFRTNRQQIIDGLSYKEYLGTKLLLITWLALISTFLLALTGLYLGFNNNLAVTNPLSFEKTSFLAAYFIELVTYLCLAFLIALIIKRAGLSIGLLILYTWIIEPLFAYSLPMYAKKFLPLENLSNMIQFPFKDILGEVGQESITPEVALIAILYIIVFNILAYLLIRYRDL